MWVHFWRHLYSAFKLDNNGRLLIPFAPNLPFFLCKVGPWHHRPLKYVGGDVSGTSADLTQCRQRSVILYSYIITANYPQRISDTAIAWLTIGWQPSRLASVKIYAGAGWGLKSKIQYNHMKLVTACTVRGRVTYYLHVLPTYPYLPTYHNLPTRACILMLEFK